MIDKDGEKEMCTEREGEKNKQQIERERERAEGRQTDRTEEGRRERDTEAKEEGMSLAHCSSLGPSKLSQRR